LAQVLGDCPRLDGGEYGKPAGEKVLEAQPLGIILAAERPRLRAAQDIREPRLVALEQQLHQRVGLGEEGIEPGIHGLAERDQLAIWANRVGRALPGIAADKSRLGVKARTGGGRGRRGQYRNREGQEFDQHIGV
jgi:hypothetical protein